MKSLLKRTQIYLSEELREEIDKLRRGSGESLAEFLRKAAEEKIAMSKKKKVDLKKLADEFIGSGKPGKRGWGGIKDSYSYIRKMRRDEDSHWMKRWDEAVRSSKQSKGSKDDILVVQDPKSQRIKNR